jgi:hypothetical protein
MANEMTADLSVAADPGELSCPFGGGSPGAAPGTRPRPKRGYLLPGTIALVVCAAIAVVIDLAGIQSHTPTTLAGHQIESLVSQSLQAQHPQRNPPQVRCPASEPLRAGLAFDCSLVQGGRPAGTIRVTELSGAGALHVSPITR